MTTGKHYPGRAYDPCAVSTGDQADATLIAFVAEGLRDACSIGPEAIRLMVREVGRDGGLHEALEELICRARNGVTR